MNRTWDYVLEAAECYAHVNLEAIDEGNGATAFGEPIVYWMNRAASDSAHEFYRMVAELGMPERVAQVAVQLSPDMVMAMSAAQEILGLDYGEWLKAKVGPSEYLPAPQ